MSIVQDILQNNLLDRNQPLQPIASGICHKIYLSLDSEKKTKTIEKLKDTNKKMLERTQTNFSVMFWEETWYKQEDH